MAGKRNLIHTFIVIIVNARTVINQISSMTQLVHLWLNLISKKRLTGKLLFMRQYELSQCIV